MINEHDFQNRATEALEDLEERLLPVSEQHDFEVESGSGMLTLIFEEPSHAKFIISPNSPARQIWVSALSTSFKFDWEESASSFVLDKTREPFRAVMSSLITKQLGTEISL